MSKHVLSFEAQGLCMPWLEVEVVSGKQSLVARSGSRGN